MRRETWEKSGTLQYGLIVAATRCRLSGTEIGSERAEPCHAIPALPLKAMPLNKAALAGPAKLPPSAPHELTVPRDVVLHSEARAAQRRQFDQAVSAQAAELEAERQRLQALQQQQQEAELRQLRMQLGHKALPLPDRL